MNIKLFNGSTVNINKIKSVCDYYKHIYNPTHLINKLKQLYTKYKYLLLKKQLYI
uniref:Uncharacterized protein n=1 Tax=Megaviridae environmental sample TaxID=1737588 RepID=A0A5J6VL52_9VIRU|nr:MAG: hypothetical protein [Megaviridae environmental sample]